MESVDSLIEHVVKYKVKDRVLKLRVDINALLAVEPTYENPLAKLPISIEKNIEDLINNMAVVYEGEEQGRAVSNLIKSIRGVD